RNAERTKRLELDLINRAQNVVTLSFADAARLRGYGIDANPIRIAFDIPTMPATYDTSRKIGFLGKITWPPNRSALEVLINEVLPQVRAAIDPPPSLLIAGKESETVVGDGVISIGP